MNAKKSLLLLGMLAATLAPTAGPSPLAGYTVTLGGVKVSYTKSGCVAYYDQNDDTLTVELSQDAGNLTVTAQRTAAQSWGGYTDIYIAGDDSLVKAITLNGRSDNPFYVTGQIAYTKKFSSNYTVIGDTDFYGDNGLGSSDLMPWPDSISMKNGGCVGPLFGVDYSTFTDASGKLSGEYRLKLK
jgi:hypothetical protein